MVELAVRFDENRVIRQLDVLDVQAERELDACGRPRDRP
jgi:hypothetical protein